MAIKHEGNSRSGSVMMASKAWRRQRSDRLSRSCSTLEPGQQWQAASVRTVAWDEQKRLRMLMRKTMRVPFDAWSRGYMALGASTLLRGLREGDTKPPLLRWPSGVSSGRREWRKRPSQSGVSPARAEAVAFGRRREM
ncbi:hypothetical protein DPSP01_004299 [Paraphaeosphaeria sporulosa]